MAETMRKSRQLGSLQWLARTPRKYWNYEIWEFSPRARQKSLEGLKEENKRYVNYNKDKSYD